MLDDTKRWDIIHQRTSQDDDRHSVYAEEKEKLFPRGSIVVDVGGGTGDDALYFLKKGHSVILLDISDFALKVVQKKAKDAGLDKHLVAHKVDFGLHRLPLKQNSADVVYSRISLHYFPKEETIEILKTIYETLKPGGSAYLTFKSPDDTEEMEYLTNNAVVYEPSVYIENGQLRSRFSVEELKEMLNELKIADFQVHPYKEAIGVKGKEHRQVLLLNEVNFTKKQ